ncbi:MAG: hypothetical protein LBO73_03780, partial [Holosporaceae bacterium]|nr:hypothetical protein [Holosporaceae bacterium]
MNRMLASVCCCMMLCGGVFTETTSALENPSSTESEKTVPASVAPEEDNSLVGRTRRIISGYWEFIEERQNNAITVSNEISQLPQEEISNPALMNVYRDGMLKSLNYIEEIKVQLAGIEESVIRDSKEIPEIREHGPVFLNDIEQLKMKLASIEETVKTSQKTLESRIAAAGRPRQLSAGIPTLS